LNDLQPPRRRALADDARSRKTISPAAVPTTHAVRVSSYATQRGAASVGIRATTRESRSDVVGERSAANATMKRSDRQSRERGDERQFDRIGSAPVRAARCGAPKRDEV
jgi:hypothetical protein